MLGLTLLSGAVLCGPSALADATSTLSITVPTACSLSSTVDTEHTASINPGTYTSGIGQTTFKAICNDGEGFAVYAIGYSDDTYGNTTLIGANTEETIATGTATSGDTSNWAMQLTASGSVYVPAITNGFDSYHAVPSAYTKVASYNSTTDTTSGSSFTATYAAYISGTQPADTYTGQVKYVLVHPSSADAPETPPEVAERCPTRIPGGVYYMQEITSANKSTIMDQMTTDTFYSIADNRDKQAYCVAKLQDGNLWMTSNLNLGAVALTNTTQTTGLTSANTHLPSDGSKDIAAETFSTWIKTAETYTPSYSDPELIPSAGKSNYNNKIGTLYNYAAATAGTFTLEPGGDNYDSSEEQKIAEYDLCPAGWRLPTGFPGEYTDLLVAYSGLSELPIDSTTTPTGREVSEILQRNLGFSIAGEYGNYWASTWGNESYDRQNLFFDDSTIYSPSSTNGERFNTYSVRCIAQ